ALPSDSVRSGPIAAPNIIFIGLDSVRPDMVTDAKSLTPTLRSLLNEQVEFVNVTTPLARTFASWSAIFSGQNPATDSVRCNLDPRDLIDTSSWLPSRLKEFGYSTTYITDEARFANIDESFGFDRVIAPEIGLGDFVFGTFMDFAPLNFFRR